MLLAGSTTHAQVSADEKKRLVGELKKLKARLIERSDRAAKRQKTYEEEEKRDRERALKAAIEGKPKPKKSGLFAINEMRAQGDRQEELRDVWGWNELFEKEIIGWSEYRRTMTELHQNSPSLAAYSAPERFRKRFRQAPGTAYILLAVDTRGKGIGPSMRKDHKLLTSLFNRVFSNPKNPHLFGRGHVHTLGVDEPLEIGSLQRFFEKFKGKLTENDTFVFIYSGHGLYQPYDGNLFHFNSSPYPWPRSTIRSWMMQSGAGHVLLMNNSCSSMPGVQWEAFVEAAKPEGEFFDTIEQLFFDHSGVTEIASSTPPETSFTTGNGSLFIFSLVNLLTEKASTMDFDGDESVTWREFTRSLRLATGELFLKVRDEAGENNPVFGKALSQTPRLDTEPKFGGEVVRVTTNPKASVEFHQISVTHKQHQNGVDGFYVNFDFTIRNHANQNSLVTLYFEREDGTGLADTDKRFCTSDHKFVATSLSFKPIQNEQRYPNFRVFMPYKHLDGVFGQLADFAKIYVAPRVYVDALPIGIPERVYLEHLGVLF